MTIRNLADVEWRTPKLSGDGPYTAECHGLLEQSLGIQKALLTTSCTHALEMAALLLDMDPGNEIVLPAFNLPLHRECVRPSRCQTSLRGHPRGHFEYR